MHICKSTCVTAVLIVMFGHSCTMHDKDISSSCCSPSLVLQTPANTRTASFSEPKSAGEATPPKKPKAGFQAGNWTVLASSSSSLPLTSIHPRCHRDTPSLFIPPLVISLHFFLPSIFFIFFFSLIRMFFCCVYFPPLRPPLCL